MFFSNVLADVEHGWFSLSLHLANTLSSSLICVIQQIKSSGNTENLWPYLIHTAAEILRIAS